MNLQEDEEQYLVNNNPILSLMFFNGKFQN